VELYLHYPNTFSWRGAQLKHSDNFTFTFYNILCLPWFFLIFPRRKSKYYFQVGHNTSLQNPWLREMHNHLSTSLDVI